MVVIEYHLKVVYKTFVVYEKKNKGNLPGWELLLKTRRNHLLKRIAEEIAVLENE